MAPSLGSSMKASGSIRPLAFLPLVAAALLVLAPVVVSAESFDFEDLPVRTVVNAQYGARGVLFFGASIDNDPHARSGTRVIRSRPLNDEIFTVEPFVMTFTSPQARVAMHASNLPGAAGNGTLKVFNASGALLAQDGPKPVPNDSFNAFFEVSIGTARITRAELHIEGTAFQAIDDLVVEGGRPGPRPTTPPVVTITDPPAGAEVRQRSVAIRGTVVGDALLDTMVLRVKTGLPGDATAPTSENAVALSGAGPNRTFSLDYGLIEGPYTVTALATNTANLQGSATIDFTNRPRQVSCPDPKSQEIFDITASTRDPIQLGIFTEKLGQDGMTVRLGPGVELDFSDAPPSFFPIHVGRCATLTSFSASDPGQAGATEARTPQSLGPVLKYGPHRGDVKTFLEIRCFVGGAEHDGVRISGFSLIGLSRDAGDQSTDEVGIRVVRCVDIEISNMEIAGWAGDGITIDNRDPDSGLILPPSGRITDPEQIRIHDNFFHHNQHSSQGGHAEGYGVNVSDAAWARIFRNVFDFNRHAIATPGDTGGYAAEHNLVLKGGGYHGGFLNTYTHSFDVHGTGNCPAMCPPFDCEHLFNCGQAGIKFSYLANAFQYRRDHAIKIRGLPAQSALISENVFPHPGLEDDAGDDAINLNTRQNVEIKGDNVINFNSFGKYGVCDFDGDRIDDLFLATRATWWFSSAGEFQWTYLNDEKERLDQVRLGYFDDDVRCDVLAERDGLWVISSGGSEDWKPFGAFGASLAEVEFGRFDPNERDQRPGATRGTTHAFRREADGQWFVVRLSGPEGWQPVQSSSFPMDQLQFGDFTGDGVTDVLAVVNGRWAISKSAIGSWQRINPSLGDAVENLFIANMDPNDNIDDLLRLEYDTRQIQIGGAPRRWRIALTWWHSHNGRGPWRKWKDYVFEFPANSPEFVFPSFAFAGRFGAAPGGGTLVIDPTRVGQFYSEAEIAAGAEPDWTSLFPF